MTRNVWHWTTLILLLLVATWLRVYRLVELPPGLHYDEAANGILASEIAFEGFRPIFITSYTGKEVLYFYLAGSLMRLIGDSVFALRLASAFTGLLTISASYWLATETARALAPQAKIPYLRLAGLMTAILLATHFPHLIFSRLGFRAITQPLLQALTVATLLYALRKSSYRAFALSGLWLGLAAYSYLAVRLFPIVIFLIALPLLRRHWRGLLLALGTATLTLLPFANFLIRNPETFWVRISQVSDQQPIMADYTSSFVQSFSILLGLAGDPYWRFNNPDQ
ncbi:MAG: ArnT family glycosyltransferase, partial [Candidatus Promineifilaceae bacterium]